MDIQIFVQHCNYSSLSVNKTRPEWFSRELCWNNLLATAENSKITVIFDGEPNPTHFLYNDTSHKIVMKPAGNGGQSFLNLLTYVYSKQFDDNTILYFVEDDFIHRPNWPVILKEGFEHIGVDYITLYDHNDKYILPMYENLQSKILVSPSTHWRTIPSTTNTYAMLNSTFRKHYAIHKEYCDIVKGQAYDHEKFTRLWQEGSNLISCIPGYSTHCCEPEYMSPCINWKTIIQNY